MSVRLVNIMTLGLLFSLLGGLLCQAETKQVAEIVASLQERYKPICAVESPFVQKNFIAPLNQFREFKGTIFLKRPYFFEMQVTSPEIQRLVFDGKFFWIYTASNTQALKSPVSPEFLHHPLISLLPTLEDLERHFDIALKEPTSPGHYCLRLTLKQRTADVREVDLTVRRSDFRISEIALYYESGNYTTLVFTEVKENPSLPSERFQFVAPPETEIVENPTPVVQP